MELINGLNYKVTDEFYGKLMRVVKDAVIPYQWEALNDRVEGAEKSYCVANFRAAAGESDEKRGGLVFQDSDLAKWVEAASFSLMHDFDPELDATLEALIALISRAQQEDGYMNTYYILGDRQKRWTNLRDNHELYCVGHFVEAAVAHYRATGKKTLLTVMEKCVKNVMDTFGREEGKLRGYPGHEEIELALIKLYEVTENEEYLKLAAYFIDERGQPPLYFEMEDKMRGGSGGSWSNSPHQGGRYYQADRPVREQQEPQGHSVRANYLYSGMASLARMANDTDLYRVCKTIWQNMTGKYMYITGQVGATEYGEAFTFPYDLPNDTVYGETCAGLSLAFFAQRMLQIEAKGEYADVMERVLYNGSISGMSLDGTRFFYVNPLEVYPEACRLDERKRHVKPERQKWFGCACCPPNLARTIASITEYAASYNQDTLYQHLYIAGEIRHTFDAKEVKVVLEGQYPWQSDITATINVSAPVIFTYALRIPGWCRRYSLELNGVKQEVPPIDGYIYLRREWTDQDVVVLKLEMPVERVYAHLNVREDIGKVALQRGPMVYCLEECDNGKDLHRVYLDRNAVISPVYEPELLGGVVTLSCEGLFLESNTDALYTNEANYAFMPKNIKFIPYYAWTNRVPGEMLVWVRERM